MPFIKNIKEKIGNLAGFTTIEILIYITIFSVLAIFLVSLLTTFTRVEIKQVGSREVVGQTGFVSSIIQDTVKRSSLIDMPFGQATSVITLRMASSSLDPTSIYASSGVIYLKQGTDNPISLTSNNVKVTSFSATKHNISGSSVLEVNLSLEYNSPNPASNFSQSLQFAVSRISAATFDTSLYPASSTPLDLGSNSSKWGNGFFSGDLNVGGTVYSGSGAPGNTAVKANGNIGFYSSSQGLILKNSGGTCFLVGVNSSGTLVTSQVTCP
jgi:hypothetical protein